MLKNNGKGDGGGCVLCGISSRGGGGCGGPSKG